MHLFLKWHIQKCIQHRFVSIITYIQLKSKIVYNVAYFTKFKLLFYIHINEYFIHKLKKKNSATAIKEMYKLIIKDLLYTHHFAATFIIIYNFNLCKYIIHYLLMSSVKFNDMVMLYLI